MRRLRALGLLLLAAATNAFRLPPRPKANWALATKGSGQSTDVLDSVIEQLLSCYATPQLPEVVGKNAKAISSPAFFLRIAELADQAESRGDGERRKTLSAMSQEAVRLLSQMVENAEAQLNDANTVVETIVAAASDAEGVFRLPLGADREDAVKEQLGRFWPDCNEAFLQTLTSWISKAEQDSSSNDDVKGMADVLRRVLQIFAAESLKRDFKMDMDVPDASGEMQLAKENDAGVLSLLAANPDTWRAEMQRLISEENLTGDGLLSAVQMRVQMVVLQQANGSTRQRVQAEFLRELMAQLQEVAPTSAKREDILQKEMRDLDASTDSASDSDSDGEEAG